MAEEQQQAMVRNENVSKSLYEEQGTPRVPRVKSERTKCHGSEVEVDVVGGRVSKRNPIRWHEIDGCLWYPPLVQS